MVPVPTVVDVGQIVRVAAGQTPFDVQLVLHVAGQVPFEEPLSQASPLSTIPLPQTGGAETLTTTESLTVPPAPRQVMETRFDPTGRAEST